MLWRLYLLHRFGYKIVHVGELARIKNWFNLLLQFGHL